MRSELERAVGRLRLHAPLFSYTMCDELAELLEEISRSEARLSRIGDLASKLREEMGRSEAQISRISDLASKLATQIVEKAGS